MSYHEDGFWGYDTSTQEEQEKSMVEFETRTDRQLGLFLKYAKKANVEIVETIEDISTWVSVYMCIRDGKREERSAMEVSLLLKKVAHSKEYSYRVPMVVGNFIGDTISSYKLVADACKEAFSEKRSKKEIALLSEWLNIDWLIEYTKVDSWKQNEWVENHFR